MYRKLKELGAAVESGQKTHRCKAQAKSPHYSRPSRPQRLVISRSFRKMRQTCSSFISGPCGSRRLK